MTIGFIAFALTLDWLLCELAPTTEEFWLDELIEEQRDNYVQSVGPGARTPCAALQSRVIGV